MQNSSVQSKRGGYHQADFEVESSENVRSGLQSRLWLSQPQMRLKPSVIVRI